MSDAAARVGAEFLEQARVALFCAIKCAFTCYRQVDCEFSFCFLLVLVLIIMVVVDFFVVVTMILVFL